MRDYKFRVWDLFKNKMHDWRDIFNLPAWEIFRGTPEQRPFKVMQFTGLRDKNNTEIYEGDILKYVFNDGGENIRFVHVVFEESGFKMKEIYRNYWLEKVNDVLCIKRGVLDFYNGKLHELYKSNEIYSTEVIGNIYVNPHLLEVPDGEKR